MVPAYASGASSLGSTESFHPLKRFFWHMHDHVVPHERNNYHPHVLGHRAVAWFALLLFTVKISAVALLVMGPVLPAYSSAITTDNVISLTNQSRAEFKLGSFIQNGKLAQAAQAKANDMLAKQYFAHNTPDGHTPWDFIKSTGYAYLLAGENLAVDFTEAENVETAWMNSPGHRANILNKDFQEIGIGISEGQFEGHHSIFVVQMFGTSQDQPIAVRDQTTTVANRSIQVQASSANQNATPIVKAENAANTSAKELTIVDTQMTVAGSNMHLVVTTSDTASRVIAKFGDQAVMLDPKGNNTWQADIPLNSLAKAGQNVDIEAYDIKGALANQRVASFSSSTAANFGTAANAQPSTINFFGHYIDIKDLEKRFYALLISGILTALLIAILIRKRVHRVSMVANASFVAMLATIMLMTG